MMEVSVKLLMIKYVAFTDERDSGVCSEVVKICILNYKIKPKILVTLKYNRESLGTESPLRGPLASAVVQIILI